jgi:hypothetical protein
MRVAGYLALLAVLSTGCASLPAPTERGLYVDLRQVVASAERLDWVVDRLEVEAIRPEIMRSMCYTPRPARRSLRLWLGEQIAEEGGPSVARYALAGEDADNLSRIRHLERVALLLDAAEERVGECPYWIEPSSGFAGVHSDAHRWVLMAETMPSLQILLAKGVDTRIGGAGLGRILIGRGLSHRLTLSAGFETGLASVVSQDTDESLQITPAFALGIPAVLRWHDGPLRVDLGTAFTARSPDVDFGNPRFGVRWSVGVGVATLRVLGVQPYVMLWTGHEYQFARDDDPGQHGLRIGTRVGVNWDP